jgi:acyl-CoA synthetase (NDP forming)
LIRGGVSLVDEHFCADLGAIDRLAASLSYPVVAKLLSDEVTHKSDVGGVLTNLGSIEQLRAAAAQILSLPGAKGVVVQPQLSGLEAIVGGLRDAQFGPCVMVGLGGIMVEVLGDVAIRLAPLGLTEAIDALRSLRGRALLEGVRGSEPVHLEALAELVVAVGDLMHCNPHIAELDLNPVIATAHEVVAVDYRLIGGSLTHRG